MLLTEKNKRELAEQIAAPLRELIKVNQDGTDTLADSIVSLSTRVDAVQEECITAIDFLLQNIREELQGAIGAGRDETLEVLRKQTRELFEEAVAADRKRRYESDEPYVEIVGENFGSEGGVGLRLDWNQAFVKYLRDNGFNGPNDEAIVDNWVTSLGRQAIQGFSGTSEFK